MDSEDDFNVIVVQECTAVLYDETEIRMQIGTGLQIPAKTFIMETGRLMSNEKEKKAFISGPVILLSASALLLIGSTVGSTKADSDIL